MTEDRPDYVHAAAVAERKAAVAGEPELAREWRRLAEAYRRLAEQDIMLRRFLSGCWPS